MGDVCGGKKLESMKQTSPDQSLQTPPRTPTIAMASAQTLASELKDIYYALSELPDVTPGDKVNALLTRLVNLCTIPYSHDFITYFFGIEGIHTLCTKLRLLCATAEGELEQFWARKIVEESRNSKGACPTIFRHAQNDQAKFRILASDIFG